MADIKLTRMAVPFRPALEGGDPAEEVAYGLNSAIRKHSQLGWRYSHMETVLCAESVGCLGALLGATARTHSIQLLIFEKPEGQSGW